VDGIVIDVTSADLGRIEGFVLRTNDGRSLTFSVAALALDRGGKPAPHLREHMASGEPIEVDFRADGDRLLAVRYRDAPPAPVPSATPAPSPTPTEGAQPSQPAGSPSARPTDGAPPSPTAPGEPPPIGFAALADRFEGLTLLTHAADGSTT